MLMKNPKPPHQDFLDLGFTEDQAIAFSSRFAQLPSRTPSNSLLQWLCGITLPLIIGGIAGLYAMMYNAQTHTADNFTAQTASFQTRIDQTEAILQNRIDQTEAILQNRIDQTELKLLAAIATNRQSIAENRNDIIRIKTLLEERLPPRFPQDAALSIDNSETPANP